MPENWICHHRRALLPLRRSAQTVCYDEGYRLELALAPHSLSSLNFVGPWLPHRFEAIGRFFVLPPRQLANVHARAGLRSAIVCHLDRDICPELGEWEPEWTDGRLSAGINVEESCTLSTMMRMAEELRYPGFASDALIECYAHEMAIYLLRYFNSTEDKPMRGAISPRRLRLIDERIREGAEPPSVKQLADLCGLSVRQLSRGFRASQGISIGDYVAKSRLSRAMGLLREGQAIKSVAFAAGFKSAASFSYAFRKAMGITPSQYQADPLTVRRS